MATQKKPNEKKPKAKGKKRGFNLKKVLFGMIIAAILAVICALGAYMLIIINGAHLLKENINKLDTNEASHIYDVSGNEVTKLFRENRESVEAKDIPERLQQAFIATEDRRFKSHSGIDFWAIGRALVKDITQGSAVEGGSTITQQLAKNVFLTSQKTVFRKATEVSIAIALDNNYSKDEILKYYLNRIYFGNGAHGVKAAAKLYFGVSDLNKLELWQMATLAAIPKAPSYYSPLENPDKSKERRGVVLKLMADQGYITEDERAKATAQEFKPQPQSNKKDYLTFTDYVVKETKDLYGIEEEDLLTHGYKIYTTMDANAQKIMEQTYAQDKFFQKQKDGDDQKIQSSMVIINHKDGGIVAMVGGRDYVSKGLNRAASPLAARQPGSSFKPIVVYAPAIDTGRYNPYSKLSDVQQSFGDYTPRNYNNVYQDNVTMFDAVKQSINVPAVWLLNEIKLKTGMQFASRLGITFDPKDSNLAIALGGLTKGTTPLQMAQAYSAFANQGIQNKSHSIVKIVDTDDHGIDHEVAAFKPDKKQAMSAKTAYYTTLLLQGVVQPGGTGTAANFERPVAGKTGSTQLDLKGYEQYYRDIWFVGYTPEWTAAVWEGFDKTDTKHFVTDSSGRTAAIFKEVMSKALANKPKTNFAKPDGVPDLAAPPNSIGDLAAAYVKETKSAKLTWTPLGDNISYQVFRKEAKQKDFEMITLSALPEVNDITVKAGESYQYYVVALNTDTSISGDKSNIAEIAIPQNSTPLEPSPLPINGNNGGNQPGGKPGKPGVSGTRTGVTGNGTDTSGTGSGAGTVQGPVSTDKANGGGTTGGTPETSGQAGGTESVGTTGGTKVTPKPSPGSASNKNIGAVSDPMPKP